MANLNFEQITHSVSHDPSENHSNMLIWCSEDIIYYYIF